MKDKKKKSYWGSWKDKKKHKKAKGDYYQGESEKIHARIKKERDKRKKKKK